MSGYQIQNGAVSSNPARQIRIITSLSQLPATPSDGFLIINLGTPSSITMTLPSVPADNQIITVKDGSGNAEANNITIVAQSGSNIDGAAAIVLYESWSSQDLLWNGSNWNAI